MRTVDYDLLFALYGVLFPCVGVSALGFCGLSLSLAIRAGVKGTKGVTEEIATTIPEIGLNAFGAIVTQCSTVDTGFWIYAGLAWITFLVSVAFKRGG